MPIEWKHPRRQPGGPPPGPIPVVPVTIGGQQHKFELDTAAPQTVVNNSVFRLREAYRKGHGTSSYPKGRGLTMKFKRQREDGTEEEVQCKQDVILGDANLLGMDQLAATATAMGLSFGGSSPSGGLFPRTSTPPTTPQNPSPTPTPLSGGVLWLHTSIKGKGCDPVKLSDHPDPRVRRGEFPTLVDSAASFSTIGPGTFEQLKACEGVKQTGTTTISTNAGLKTVPVVQGVEITFPLADGTKATCKLPVLVVDFCVIGTDQLKALGLGLVFDPKRGRGGIHPAERFPDGPVPKGGRGPGGGRGAGEGSGPGGGGGWYVGPWKAYEESGLALTQDVGAVTIPSAAPTAPGAQVAGITYKPYGRGRRLR